MTGLLKLSGMISDFAVWDDTINSYVEKFHEQYHVYPNILIACDFTYRKLSSALKCTLKGWLMLTEKLQKQVIFRTMASIVSMRMIIRCNFA